MKPGLLLLFTLSLQTVFSQSLDYISVRKKNGRVVKNFYAGSGIVLQTIDGSYLQGVMRGVRDDSIFVEVTDVRTYATNIGSFIRDTVSVSIQPVYYKDILRIYLNKRTGILGRTVAPLLMIGGAGYAALNILNGTLFRGSITGAKNLKTLGIAGGVFGLGFLLRKLLVKDGFSKKAHRIVYVDL